MLNYLCLFLVRVWRPQVHKLEVEVSGVEVAPAAAGAAWDVLAGIGLLVSQQCSYSLRNEQSWFASKLFLDILLTLKSKRCSGISNPASIHSLYIR